MWYSLSNCETEIHRIISQKVSQISSPFKLEHHVVQIIYNNSHFINVGTEKLKCLIPSQAMTTYYTKI